MSDNIVEIIKSPNYSVTIDTSLVQNDNNIIIELFDSNNIDVINNTTVLVGDLPQGYPLDWTVGLLPIVRVSGLVGANGVSYNDGTISLSGVPAELLPVQNLLAGSGINVTNNSGVFTVAVTGQFGLTGEEVDDRVNQLLTAGNNIVLNYNDNSNILTISTSGLQPSGDYSLQGHSHGIDDINGLQNILDNKQPSGVYASGIHYHTHSDVTDFNSSVDSRIVAANLQPSGNYSLIGHSHSSSDINDFNSSVDSRISLANLQPSGNYSVVGHLHASSDITDFESSVSGLLPVKNVSAGNGIQITNTSGDFNVAVTGQFGLTGEQVDDRVNDLLVPSNYITINYDDNLNKLTIGTSGLQPTGNYSIVGHSHLVSDVSGLQNILDNKQPSGNYAPSIHSHSRTDITDFNSGVSGLLPSVSGSGYINSIFNNNTYLISVTGLQPSGNYSIVGHSHAASEITNFNSSVSGLVNGIYAPLNSPNLTGVPTAPTAASGTNTTQIANTQFVRNEISNLINSAPTTLDTLNELSSALGNDPNFATTIASGLANKAPLIHNHVSSDIANFNTSVSGLLPTVSGTGYISSTFNNNIYSISVTGLQPSGNYSVVGHVHSSNDITNFNSGVSGLLPNINGSGYIQSVFNSNNNTYTIYSSGLTTSDITNFASGVSDNLTTTILGGNFINLTYDSTLDTLTISTSGLQPSGNYSVVGHSHVVSDITNFASGVSGLLPTISNSGNNRLLTSNGTTTGISAQNNLTFNGSLLNVSGSGIFASGLNISNQTSNTIASFDSNKNLTSLSTSTYPSLNELSYLKGVNSALQTQLDNKQPSGNYSIVGHSHTSNSITDFNSTVSGLLPVKNILAGSGLSISSSGGVYSIGSTLGNSPVFSGLTVANFVHSTATNPINGNPLYLISGPDGGPCMYFNSEDINLFFGQFKFNIDGSLSFSDSSVQTTAWTGSINTSKINNFNSSVSGLLPVTNILAGSNIGVFSSGSVFTVAVTGQLGLTTEEVDDRVATLLVAGTGIDLTYNDAANALVITSVGSSPSGNYALAGHTHVAANITDFSSAVSGLLPITNILGGSNISVSQSGTNFTVAVTGSLGLTSEEVDDRVASLLVASSGISLNYDDPNNLLTISTTGLQPSGNYSLVGHNHTSSSITDFNTSVSGLLPVTNIVAGSGISLSSTSGLFTINSNNNIINSSNLYLWSNFR